MANKTGPKHMSEGQRSYEEKRAAKAGVSLEKWLQMKERDRADDERARQAAITPPPPRKPGLLSRLIERAHKPL